MVKMYKVGDRVKIVKKAQERNCAWNSYMDATLGKVGTVITATKADGAKTTQVKIDGVSRGDDEWYYLPESLEPAVTVDFTKEVKDEMGNVLEILTTSALGEFPVIYRNAHGSLYRASLNGKSESGLTTLSNPTILATGTKYINIYRRKDGSIEVGMTKDTLDAAKSTSAAASSPTIARVKVEFTEGVFQE